MKKLVRMFAGLSAFILLSLFSSMASAQGCPTSLSLIGPASISFDPNLSVGTVLWRGSVRTPGGPLGCGESIGTGGYQYYEGVGAQVNSIYETGIPGIGYRIGLNRTDCVGGWWPVNTSCMGVQGWSTWMNPHELLVELVKTGGISSGGRLVGKFALIRVGAREIINYVWTGSVVVTPTAPTCVVTTPSVQVPLGGVPALALASGPSASLPFDIKLSCSGGNGGRTTAISVTLTDATNPANRSKLLSLTRGSTAAGVAIEVLKDGGVLGYGEKWGAGNTAGGPVSIRLAARYVRTGPITSGSANGQATFTMSYQ